MRQAGSKKWVHSPTIQEELRNTWEPMTFLALDRPQPLFHVVPKEKGTDMATPGRSPAPASTKSPVLDVKLTPTATLAQVTLRSCSLYEGTIKPSYIIHS